MNKLPKPNAVVALNDEKAHQMTPAHIRGIICNPIYAGLPPFPRTISDEEWITAAQKAIQEDGLPQFLVNMLHVLRESYRNILEEDQDDVCGECGAHTPPDTDSIFGPWHEESCSRHPRNIHPK
jgi:hypothetical protein